MEKGKKKQLYSVTAVICACVAIGAIVYLIHYNMTLKQQEDAYTDLRQTEQTENLMEEEAETQTENSETITCEAVYDFEELRETNEDIYAWITVPGTLVDYPILQSEEDNYYLDKNLDHSTGYPGCIYTNACNSKDFSSYHTVIYGHNMKNDSMFGSLHEYASKDFFDTNREIIIYTEEKRLTYEIYGAVKYTDTYITAYYDIESAEGNEAFLKDLLMNAAQSSDVSHIAEMEISAEDKLVTLSTCVPNEDTKRYIIVGVLVEEAYYTE